MELIIVDMHCDLRRHASMNRKKSSQKVPNVSIDLCAVNAKGHTCLHALTLNPSLASMTSRVGTYLTSARNFETFEIK
jgi:hypothetical protein